MNLNGHETDGVPAPSDYELRPSHQKTYRDLYRMTVDLNTTLKAQLDVAVDKVDALAAEVERLRGFLRDADLCDGDYCDSCDKCLGS